MSAAELAGLRNWANPDPDGDGIFGAADNCAEIANPDQVDLDADGAGDACDDDVDGDGLTNVAEERLGTNGRGTDSDGDGTPDGLDRCPTLGWARAGLPSAGERCRWGGAGPGPAPLAVPARVRPTRLAVTGTRRRARRRVTINAGGRLVLPAGSLSRMAARAERWCSRSRPAGGSSPSRWPT